LTTALFPHIMTVGGTDGVSLFREDNSDFNMYQCTDEFYVSIISPEADFIYLDANTG